MGGRKVHREPSTLAVSDEAREIIAHAGWTTHFTRFKPPNEEIAIKFLWHLRNRKSLRGIQITAIDVVIKKVFGLLAEGLV